MGSKGERRKEEKNTIIRKNRLKERKDARMELHLSTLSFVAIKFREDSLQYYSLFIPQSAASNSLAPHSLSNKQWT